MQVLLTTVGAFAAFGLMTIAISTDYWLYTRALICNTTNLTASDDGPPHRGGGGSSEKKDPGGLTHSGLWRICCLEGRWRPAVPLREAPPPPLLNLPSGLPGWPGSPGSPGSSRLWLNGHSSLSFQLSASWSSTESSPLLLPRVLSMQASLCVCSCGLRPSEPPIFFPSLVFPSPSHSSISPLAHMGSLCLTASTQPSASTSCPLTVSPDAPPQRRAPISPSFLPHCVFSLPTSYPSPPSAPNSLGPIHSPFLISSNPLPLWRFLPQTSFPTCHTHSPLLFSPLPPFPLVWLASPQQASHQDFFHRPACPLPSLASPMAVSSFLHPSPSRPPCSLVPLPFLTSTSVLPLILFSLSQPPSC